MGGHFVNIKKMVEGSTKSFQNRSGSVFVTAASFLNITAKTGIANLSEISYYEILANEHHHISP